MQTIANIIEDIGESDEPIPLTNISAETLVRVIEYTDKYLDAPFEPVVAPSDDSLIPQKPREFLPWELEFFNGSWSNLKAVMLAANFLDYQILLQACAQFIASQIIKMTPEEVKEYCSA